MRSQILIAALLTLAAPVLADFAPVALAPESYNQDLIVERSAPGPVVPVTNASMEGGTNNVGFSWYERGYNTDSPATGLPVAGATLTSESLTDHDFQFPPSYRTNNVVLLDATVPAGGLTLTAPAPFAGLSVLTSSGNAATTIGYAVHHQDGSVETGSLDSPNWFGFVGQAFTTYGRVDVQSFVFAGVHDPNPMLFSRDLLLTNTTSAVVRADFTYLSGAGHAVIFALSGSAAPGEPYVPVAVTGFNRDLVVEATAVRPGRIGTVTSATLEGGLANVGRTFYEAGYNPLLPASGVPAPGTLLTNAAAPDHRYLLPASFASNNAALLDPDVPNVALTPAAPTVCSALSLLCAASGGPVTNDCRVQHADGTDEDHRIIVPDWLAAGPAAFEVNGRVNIDTRFADYPGGGAPRLFETEFAITNAASPVTNLLVSFVGGARPDAHAVILALSSQAQASFNQPRLAVTRNPDGTLQLISTMPGVLESTTHLRGVDTVWSEEGAISSSLTLAPVSGEPARFYRVRTTSAGTQAEEQL